MAIDQRCAAAESTPPERADHSSLLAHGLAHLANRPSMKCCGVSHRAPQMFTRSSAADQCRACVVDLRMKLHRPDLRDSFSIAANALLFWQPPGRQEVWASSPCDIHTLSEGGKPAKRRDSSIAICMAIFALRPRTHFAAQLMSDEVQAVADTQHRQT